LQRLIEPLVPAFTVDPSGAGAEAFRAQVSAETLRRRLGDPDFRFELAEDDHGLAGFVAMRGPCHLFHLFVAADRQGQGVGSQLWRRAREESVRLHGCDAFTLYATLNARAFYERHGFRATGPVQRQDGIEFVPMRLERSGDDS